LINHIPDILLRSWDFGAVEDDHFIVGRQVDVEFDGIDARAASSLREALALCCGPFVDDMHHVPAFHTVFTKGFKGVREETAAASGAESRSGHGRRTPAAQTKTTGVSPDRRRSFRTETTSWSGPRRETAEAEERSRTANAAETERRRFIAPHSSRRPPE